jgi:hypothetical protein
MQAIHSLLSSPIKVNSWAGTVVTGPEVPFWALEAPLAIAADCGRMAGYSINPLE